MLNRVLSQYGRLMFSLSNVCPNAYRHVKCPAHHATTIEVLPARIVRHVIDTFAEYGYSPAVSWHCYNEPLVDPRLSSLTEYARAKLPQSAIILWSSGCYLTRDLMEELIASGITKTYLTAYSESEYHRLTAIGEDIGISWVIFRCWEREGGTRLDDRMQWDDICPRSEWRPCKGPYRELMIWPSGEIGLCCFDWKRTKLFGSLQEGTLADNMATHGAELLKVQKQLLAGQRQLEMCQCCRTRR